MIMKIRPLTKPQKMYSTVYRFNCDRTAVIHDTWLPSLNQWNLEALKTFKAIESRIYWSRIRIMKCLFTIAEMQLFRLCVCI